MPSVNISEETFQRLAERAASLNVTIESLVQPALDRLANERPEDSHLPLTGEAWKAAFEEWNRAAEERAHRYPPGFVLDDSRETIYREREDAQL